MEEEMEMEIQIQMLPSSLCVSLGNMYGVKSCIGIWGGCDGGVAVLGDGRDMEEGEGGICGDWRDTCGDWRDTVEVGSL